MSRLFGTDGVRGWFYDDQWSADYYLGENADDWYHESSWCQK